MIGDFKRDILGWPSRGVLATHDYGCPPHDAEGLRRHTEAVARRERALLDARERKALHLAPQTEGTANGQIRSSLEPDGDGQRPAAAR